MFGPGTLKGDKAVEKLTLLALLSCFVLSMAFPGIVGGQRPGTE
jgi:hypothetical protein